MNKAVINKEITYAYEALKDEKVGIAKNGKIKKTYRNHISTLGVAIMSGSLLPAIAFFRKDEDGKEDVKKSNLLKAVFFVLEKEKKIDKKDLFDYVKAEKENGREDQCKEDVLNAAIALKLAMNLYTLVEEKKAEK